MSFGFVIAIFLAAFVVGVLLGVALSQTDSTR